MNLTVPMVNMIYDLAEQQILTRQLRLALALWNIEAQPSVPEARRNGTLSAEVIRLAEQLQPFERHRLYLDQLAKD